MTDAELMTPEEFGARLQKSGRWVRDNYRDLPHCKVGGSLRFTEEHYRRYLALIDVDPRPMTTRRKNRK